MKVVYKIPIETRINTEITTAKIRNKKIDHILVDDDEWDEFIDHLDNIVVSFKCEKLPLRFDNKKYCMFDGIAIVKENS